MNGGETGKELWGKVEVGGGGGGTVEKGMNGGEMGGKCGGRG